VWGKLVPAERSLAEHALPIGLAHGVRTVRDIAAGAVVTWADVESHPNDAVVTIRREMEATFRPFA
jgi:predicted homoserine dehydrogenase-like protein